MGMAKRVQEFLRQFFQLEYCVGFLLKIRKIIASKALRLTLVHFFLEKVLYGVKNK